MVKRITVWSVLRPRGPGLLLGYAILRSKSLIVSRSGCNSVSLKVRWASRSSSYNRMMAIEVFE
jgi:hypothetical protein